MQRNTRNKGKNLQKTNFSTTSKNRQKKSVSNSTNKTISKALQETTIHIKSPDLFHERELFLQTQSYEETEIVAFGMIASPKINRTSSKELQSPLLPLSPLTKSPERAQQDLDKQTNQYTVMNLNGEEEKAFIEGLEFDQIFQQLPPTPERPPAPPLTLLFNSEQLLKLDAALSIFPSRQSLDESIRYLIECGFRPEQVVEIITQNGHMIVQALKDTLNEFNQLKFNADHIFEVIKVKGFVAMKIVKTHFQSLKNINLSPDRLLEIMLNDPFLTSSSMPMPPAHVVKELLSQPDETVVRRKKASKYEVTKHNGLTFKMVNPAAILNRGKAKAEKEKQRYIYKHKVDPTKVQAEPANISKLTEDKRSIVKPFLLSNGFTHDMIDEVLSKYGTARLEVLYTNASPLMALGFSATQLYQIISNANTNPIVLDLLRSNAASLNKFFKLNTVQLVEMALCPNSHLIFNAISNCLIELVSLTFKAEDIMQLVKLPNAATAIDKIKAHYDGFYDEYFNKKPKFGLTIHPAVVPSLIVNLITLSMMSGETTSQQVETTTTKSSLHPMVSRDGLFANKDFVTTQPESFSSLGQSLLGRISDITAGLEQIYGPLSPRS